MAHPGYLGAYPDADGRGDPHGGQMAQTRLPQTRMAQLRRRSARWAGYAAAAWGLLFAAASFYWAAGGRFGLDTLPSEISERRDFWFVLFGLWGAGAAKLCAGALGLALTRSAGHRLRYRPLLVLGGLAGIALSLYGGLNLLVRALMAVGLMHTPASMHSAVATWHLVLWDPWWMVGGLLLLAATGGFRCRAARASDDAVSRGAGTGRSGGGTSRRV